MFDHFKSSTAMFALGLFLVCDVQSFAYELTVQCDQIQGSFRALHGLNGGVLIQGETVDLTRYWKAAGIPLTRLHDCEWPAPNVVDVHAIFPDFRNAADDPESYRFAPTDDYIAAIIHSGSGIVYRLGESIEHTKRKHYVHPPKDFHKWADICRHAVKHYNEGWSDGFHYGIKYWEIWNEPENKPQMWTGTDDEYFEMYLVASKILKEEFPHLKIGGPSIGAGFVKTENGWELSPYAQQFLRFAKNNDAPLDFYSWHTYTDQPMEYVDKAVVARKFLDEIQFTETELHLNEWNYLPDNDWGPMLNTDDPKRREAWFERIGGAEGAGFVACVLINLQSAPVDVSNYFTNYGGFGIFAQYGAPRKTYYAMKAFNELLRSPIRLLAEGGMENTCSIAAGTNEDRSELTVLIGTLHHSEPKTTIILNSFPWEGQAEFEKYTIDAIHDFEKTDNGSITIENRTVRLELETPESSVILLKFSVRACQKFFRMQTK